MGKGTDQVEFAQRLGLRLEPERQRLWRVVRYVREEYEVQAATRADALLRVSDPHTVTVTSQACTPADE